MCHPLSIYWQHVVADFTPPVYEKVNVAFIGYNFFFNETVPLCGGLLQKD